MRAPAFLNSSLDMERARAVERDAGTASSDLLYVAPERLVTRASSTSSTTCATPRRLALFAIDEAHCVAVGPRLPPGIPPALDPATSAGPDHPAHRAHRHRRPPDPRGDRRTPQPAATRAASSPASTAPTSATHGRKTTRAASCSPSSANGHRGQAGIVYCLSRRKVDRTAAWLRSGHRRPAYHAGMDAEGAPPTRPASCARTGWSWSATIAFGMGIDKPDVRFVAHLDLPKIEGYYQRAPGARKPARRAGRPGRGHRLPPPAPAGVFRRTATRVTAATATTACIPPQTWDATRRRARPVLRPAPASATAPATSSTCCAARHRKGGRAPPPMTSPPSASAASSTSAGAASSASSSRGGLVAVDHERYNARAPHRRRPARCCGERSLRFHSAWARAQPWRNRAAAAPARRPGIADGIPTRSSTACAPGARPPRKRTQRPGLRGPSRTPPCARIAIADPRTLADWPASAAWAITEKLEHCRAA